MIRILREDEYRRRIGPEKILRVATGYLHRVAIPRHVYSFSAFSDKKGILRMAGEEFIFPREIGQAVKKEYEFYNAPKNLDSKFLIDLSVQ